MDQKKLNISESSSDSSNFQNAQRLTDDEFDNFSNHEDQHTIGTSEDVPIIDTQPTIGIGIKDSQNEEQIESEGFVDEAIPLSTKFRTSEDTSESEVFVDEAIPRATKFRTSEDTSESEVLEDEDIPLAAKFRRSKDTSGLRDLWHQNQQTIDLTVSQTQEVYIPPVKKFRRSQLAIDTDFSQSEELYDSPAGASSSQDLFKCSEVSQIVSPKMDEPGTSGLSSEEIKLSNIAFLDEISEKCLKMVEDETDEDIEEMYAIACSRYLDKFLLKKHQDDIQARQKLLAKIKKAGEEGILS